jgi:hypothetical protein
LDVYADVKGGGEPAHGAQPMAPMKMDEGAGHGEGTPMAPGMGSLAGHETGTATPGMAMPGMQTMEGA